ncbi:PFGI-1 class ICE element type IV pilus protein PilL2 [Photobacterium leiognathi]|uniref:PFGI-1 class ICE element type IV pilus protein PilL2 n=1 Tax=Photobacterium leiognathi TaxID=553611 RepID=UPI002982321F|nr:hypothetical protein [Photobacterium leiognathi]
MRTSLTVVVGALLTGCVSTPAPAPVIPSPAPPLNIRIAPDIVDMGKTVRSSRYVTESAVPALRVRDVLSNDIDVSIPIMPNMTIKQGLTFLLKGTGYTIRPASSYAESQLYKQPLPLVQTNMGYMSVRQALQVIGGAPWHMEEDVVMRQIGFRLKDGYVWNTPSLSTRSTIKPSSKAPSFSHRDAGTMTPMDSLLLPKAETKTATLKPSMVKAGEKNASTVPFTLTKAKSSSVTSAVPPSRTYSVSPNQTAISALRQWIQTDKAQVAWALSPQAENALNQKGHTIKAASLSQAVAQLRNATKQPIYMTQQGNNVAIHSLPGPVDVVWVRGNTLKAGVESVVSHYKWKWKDDNSASPSWIAPDDYALRSAYPVVTAKGDIAEALNVVLEGYPVQAQLLYGTQEVFITEKQ